MLCVSLLGISMAKQVSFVKREINRSINQSTSIKDGVAVPVAQGVDQIIVIDISSFDPSNMTEDDVLYPARRTSSVAVFKKKLLFSFSPSP